MGAAFQKSMTVPAVAIGLAISLSHCTDSNFSGKQGQVVPPKVNEAVPPPDDDVVTAPGFPTPPEESVRPECTVNLDYRPEDIQCNLLVKGNNVWATVAGWRDHVLLFGDEQARWISPLAAVVDASGVSRCPDVPSIQKLIYTSTFVVREPGVHTVESRIDDGGTVYIWRDGDPTKEMISHTDHIQRKPVTLDAGRYTVIIDAIDSGAVATAAVFSLKGPSGNVIKRSESDGSWCIFRADANADTRAFVQDAGRCRPCFNPLMGTAP